MNFIFGKEDFENANKGSFDTENQYLGTVSYDNTGKVSGEYSLKCSVTDASGIARLEKTISDYYEIYAQFKILIPTGYSYGGADFISTIGLIDDLAGNTGVNITIASYDDTIRFYVGSSDTTYTTGKVITKGQVCRLEVYVKKSASEGIVKLWVDNNDVENPDFVKESFETGSDEIGFAYLGLGSNGVPDSVYYSDFILSGNFIGKLGDEGKIVDIDKPKTYLYKFYDIDGNFQTAFSGDYGGKILNKPQYTWSIFGGKGDVTIDSSLVGNDLTSYVSSNSFHEVKIFMHDKETEDQGKQIYDGLRIDENIGINQNGFSSFTPLYISGESDLSKKVVENTISGLTTISYSSQDFSTIYMDLLDKYALKGGIVTYTSSSIDTVGTTLSYTAKNETYLDTFRRLAGYLPEYWHWYIDGENVFHLHKTNLNHIDHRFIIGKSVNQISLKLSYGDIVNTIFFFGGDTGGGSQLYRRYENTTSQSTYGKNDMLITDERVTTVATAQLRSETELELHSSPIRYVEFNVLDSNGSLYGYDIDRIQPGDVISLISDKMDSQTTTWKNDGATLGNMVWDMSKWDFDINASLRVPYQVQEIKYFGDFITIKASDIIANQATTIDQLRKQLNATQTIDSPTTPS